MPIISNFHHILHGGDYNPDQWQETPEIIDEDFRLMDKVGCNTFSVGIFFWSQLEQEEGNFDFSWLDDIFRRAELHGKKLFLATPSAARPGWLAAKYPETNLTDANGCRTPWHTRQTHCLNSPILREKVCRINRLLAQRYSHHPALAGWHISNEYSSECFCPDCIAGFHDFLRRRYQTLQNLNHCYWSAFWGHHLSDWNEIDPRDQCVQIAGIDWKRYLTELHSNFFQMEIDAIRPYSDLPITTNMMGLYGMIDYWKIVRQCDFICDDCYPTWYPGMTEAVAAQFSALHDMHYAMKNKPFLIMESCPGTVNYKTYMRPRRPDELQREHLMALGHGADGTLYFQWRKGRGNCEQHHGAVVGHDGTDQSMVFKSVADYGKKLDNIAEILDSTRSPQAAVILDWEARWALEKAALCNGSDEKKHDQTIFTHYQALWQNNLDLAVIDQDQEFNRYQLLIAPMQYLLKDGIIEKLRDYVQQGGTLVMTYFSAWVDASNLCYFGGNPGGPQLKELFGIWSEELDGLTPESRQSITWNGKTYAVTELAEIIHAEGADVLASYNGEFYAGTPAVTRHSFGKGSAIYIGARTDFAFLTDFYGKLIKECGVEPVLSGLPPQINASRRIGKDGTYFFLLNLTDQPVEIQLPEPLIDLWNGKKTPRNTLMLPAAGSTVRKRTGTARIV